MRQKDNTKFFQSDNFVLFFSFYSHLKGQVYYFRSTQKMCCCHTTNVALQLERVAARITTPCSTFHATNFSVVSCICNMLHKVDPSSTFCNIFFQLATLKFVVVQVEHRVLIWATTLFNLQCNNVAHYLAPTKFSFLKPPYTCTNLVFTHS